MSMNQREIEYRLPNATLALDVAQNIYNPRGKNDSERLSNMLFYLQKGFELTRGDYLTPNVNQFLKDMCESVEFRAIQ